MVHNGIEYGIMAAYAEGLNVLKSANVGKQTHAVDAETTPLRDPEHYQYDFNLADVSEVWRRGSVIASWLLDLTALALIEDPNLTKFGGRVSDSGEGRWTIKASIDEAVPTPVLTTALYERFSSRGDADYANKLLSAMRFEFGGHLEKPREVKYSPPRTRIGDFAMTFDVVADPQAAAEKAAAIIAQDARDAVAARGRFIMAVSGGHTPWIMLRALANEDVPWAGVHVFQVDERVAPDGDPDRNLTHLHESLLEHAPISREQIHAMPVEMPDLEAAAKQYARTLTGIAGSPPVLDLVHLGLGPDGHTASLVPGDPVLDITDSDVGLTGEYMGRRRMTLTYPVINRSRENSLAGNGKRKSSNADSPQSR